MDLRLIGTSLRGLISTPYATLVERFGQPEPSPDGKCLARWIVTTIYGVGAVYDMLGREDDHGPITENTNWHISGPNDETADEISRLIRQSSGGVAVHVQATRYEACALPPNYRAWRLFALTIEYRGEGKWAVLNHFGYCYDADGEIEYEPSTSNRDDEFLARFRFSLDQALAIARRLAPKVTVNRFTVADALAHGPEWM